MDQYDDQQCWCPCNCGWSNNVCTLDSSGLCGDCAAGNHEVPPDGVFPGVKELLHQHESIIAQFRKILEDRKDSENEDTGE